MNENTNLDTMGKEENENEKKSTEEEITATKYSVIPRFWNESGRCEIPTIDIVASFNKATGVQYLNFIDVQGRLWKGREDDFIVIRNFPTKEDIEDFSRLKRESEDYNKLIHSKEQTDTDSKEGYL